ncbi:MAG: class I SAM-dependent methyltransferase, partial [Myxococcales bacterium]|nr:class I SAM-dependent methyltransferase [Myxococcales bacterium]
MAKSRKNKEKKSKDKPKDKRKKRNKPKMAELADRHELYQKSVQDPKAEVYCFNRLFKKYRDHRPLSLKEDFCGTAYLSATWVRSHKERTALGVDLEPSVLAYSREHHISKLKKNQRERITLVEANVLDITEPQFDITCALNFSYCVFKTRELLTQYFRGALASTKEDGMFICELFGGSEAIIPIEESREVEDFVYVWDQDRYNPITNEILC